MEPNDSTPTDVIEKLEAIEQKQDYIIRHLIDSVDYEMLSRNEARKEARCGMGVLDEALNSGALAHQKLQRTNSGNQKFGIMRGDLRRWNNARLSKSYM